MVATLQPDALWAAAAANLLLEGEAVCSKKKLTTAFRAAVRQLRLLPLPLFLPPRHAHAPTNPTTLVQPPDTNQAHPSPALAEFNLRSVHHPHLAAERSQSTVSSASARNLADGRHAHFVHPDPNYKQQTSLDSEDSSPAIHAHAFASLSEHDREATRALLEAHALQISAAFTAATPSLVTLASENALLRGALVEIPAAMRCAVHAVSDTASAAGDVNRRLSHFRDAVSALAEMAEKAAALAVQSKGECSPAAPLDSLPAAVKAVLSRRKTECTNAIHAIERGSRALQGVQQVAQALMTSCNGEGHARRVHTPSVSPHVVSPHTKTNHEHSNTAPGSGTLLSNSWGNLTADSSPCDLRDTLIAATPVPHWANLEVNFDQGAQRSLLPAGPLPEETVTVTKSHSPRRSRAHAHVHSMREARAAGTVGGVALSNHYTSVVAPRSALHKQASRARATALAKVRTAYARELSKAKTTLK